MLAALGVLVSAAAAAAAVLEGLVKMRLEILEEMEGLDYQLQ
jgi:hypothetical protein